MTTSEHVSGAPARNPETGARRYTGAEFVVRLWQINGPSIDILPAPKPKRKPRRKKAAA
jgi:hypothetical protein